MIQVKLGGTFKVQWLSSCVLPLSKVKNIPNPYNNNESVANSRDTTELPKETGVLICNLCYEQEKNDIMYKSKLPCFEVENIERVVDMIKKSKEGKKVHFFIFSEFKQAEFNEAATNEKYEYAVYYKNLILSEFFNDGRRNVWDGTWSATWDGDAYNATSWDESSRWCGRILSLSIIPKSDDDGNGRRWRW